MAKPDKELEARVVALENDVAALETTVAGLEDRIVALETAPPPDIEPPDVEEPPPDVEEPPPDIEEPSDASLQELVNAGGAVDLPNDAYHDFCSIGKPTQVFGLPTTISAEGLSISNGKGVFAAGADLELSDLILHDARVPDRNGTAARMDPDRSLTMTNCEVYNCEMGVLTGGGAAIHTLTRCYFHDNGAGDGNSHELYMRCKEFRLEDSRVLCGDKATHAVKTRSSRTTITNCEIHGTATSNQSIAGSVIDLCEGGEVLIENTKVIVPQTMGHSLFLGYLTENSNGGIGTVTLRNCVFEDLKGNCQLWARAGAGAKLVIENCTYTASKAPVLTGWDSVQGDFVPA